MSDLIVGDKDGRGFDWVSVTLGACLGATITFLVGAQNGEAVGKSIERATVQCIDELGVLLYGHEKNALWYGSRLSNAEARTLAPYQNATGMQVSSAVLAGMVWAIENPTAGIVETDEMDYKRCLDVQRPYLGPVEGHYTDWTPLQDRWQQFNEDIDESDPWQFRNVLAS